MYQQDGVGAAAADVTAGGQLGLLLRGEIGPAVRPDQQPVRSRPPPPGARRSRRRPRPGAGTTRATVAAPSTAVTANRAAVTEPATISVAQDPSYRRSSSSGCAGVVRRRRRRAGRDRAVAVAGAGAAVVWRGAAEPGARGDGWRGGGARRPRWSGVASEVTRWPVSRRIDLRGLARGWTRGLGGARRGNPWNPLGRRIRGRRPVVVHQVNLRAGVARMQPAHMAGQQDVADEGDRVDDPVRDGPAATAGRCGTTRSRTPGPSPDCPARRRTPDRGDRARATRWRPPPPGLAQPQLAQPGDQVAHHHDLLGEAVGERRQRPAPGCATRSPAGRRAPPRRSCQAPGRQVEQQTRDADEGGQAQAAQDVGTPAQPAEPDAPTGGFRCATTDTAPEHPQATNCATETRLRPRLIRS